MNSISIRFIEHINTYITQSFSSLQRHRRFSVVCFFFSLLLVTYIPCTMFEVHIARNFQIDLKFESPLRTNDFPAKRSSRNSTFKIKANRKRNTVRETRYTPTQTHIPINLYTSSKNIISFAMFNDAKHRTCMIIHFISHWISFNYESCLLLSYKVNNDV